MGAWADETVQRLLAKGLRNGGARRAVIELLAGQNCCLTPQEIFSTSCAPRDDASASRASDRILKLLTAEGVVQRIDLGSGTARYEPVLPDGHHHHLVCDSCGKVEAFEDPALESALTRVEQRSGYAVAAHDVVLHGACADCG